MTMWEVLLLIGAISTILNFIMNIVGTILALRRTHMQADLYKWKVNKYKAQKGEQNAR